MQNKAVQHTVDIFERLYTHTWFVVPVEIRKEMEHALEHMRDNASLTLEEVEDTLIVFGKRVWPYRKAFEDFVSIEESHRAEAIFLGKLSIEMKKRYRAFVEQGGSLSDIHAGSQMLFFTAGERTALCEAWIETQADIRDAVMQIIRSTEEKRFGERVREFRKIFADIERELQTLGHMADNEQEHPHLAAEIRAHIKGFEYGLSLLGPEADLTEICRSSEHFAGRKIELKIRA